MLEKHHTLTTNSRGFGLRAVSMSTHGMYSLRRPRPVCLGSQCYSSNGQHLWDEQVAGRSL